MASISEKSACGYVEELVGSEEGIERLSRVARVIRETFLSGDSPQFSVVDKLASAVSPRVAEVGLYEVLRVVEGRVRDVEDVVKRILRGLGDAMCVEVALEACRKIAILALAQRVGSR